MDALLVAIVLLGLPSLVAHILTLNLLYDCRKHGSQFGEESKLHLFNFQEFQNEMVKIGSDIADTLEVAFDSSTVTTMPASGGSIELANLDPKEMLLKTIATVITDKLNGAVHGGTQSEEWQVHQDSENESENNDNGTETQTEELQSD